MANTVVDGAGCTCTFGAAPGNFKAMAQMKVKIDGKTVGTALDVSPGSFTPFGMCSSLANPAVASATAAALGVLTPQPCTPVPTGAWIGVNPARMMGGSPCLNTSCQIICGCGMGTIAFTVPGQAKVTVN